MLRARDSLLVAVAVGAAGGACSGQTFTREQAVESFQEANAEATVDQADCVVDALIERYGLDELGAQLAAEPLDADFEEAQFREMFVCDVAGDWRQQITDQLIENGVREADAPCVSDELFVTMDDDDIDVLLSGELTDSFADKFFAALLSCDALDP
ncbi:MAG: hypothetical protein OEV40_14295 [Acidimicrobiia bacterium]|nr:hypothetical protein [Acidimicrobiia bacterium]